MTWKYGTVVEHFNMRQKAMVIGFGPVDPRWGYEPVYLLLLGPRRGPYADPEYDHVFRWWVTSPAKIWTPVDEAEDA